MSGGGERLIPTAVFILTFVAVSAFLVASFNDLQTRSLQNVGGHLPISPAELVANDLSIDLYTPSIQPVSGVALDGTNHWQDFEFTKPGETKVHVAVVRNQTDDWYYKVANRITSMPNTDLLNVIRRIHHDIPDLNPGDSLIYYQSWMGGTLALERRIRFDVVTFSEIISHSIARENFSVTNSHCRYWISGIVEWDMNESHGENYCLWNNQFNISVATGLNASYGHISASTVLGQLLTMTLPDVPMFIQAMIAIPCYIALIMVAVLLVSYFIGL